MARIYYGLPKSAIVPVPMVTSASPYGYVPMVTSANPFGY